MELNFTKEQSAQIMSLKPEESISFEGTELTVRCGKSGTLRACAKIKDKVGGIISMMCRDLDETELPTG